MKSAEKRVLNFASGASSNDKRVFVDPECHVLPPQLNKLSVGDKVQDRHTSELAANQRDLITFESRPKATSSCPLAPVLNLVAVISSHSRLGAVPLGYPTCFRKCARFRR